MADLKQRQSPQPGHRLETWVEGTLRSYSQVLFSSSRAVGILLVGASFVQPWVGIAALACVLVGLATASVLRFAPSLIKSGTLTFNTALVGMGIGAMFQPGLVMAGLVVCTGVATVVLTASLSTILSSAANLPSLTIPFILSMWILHALQGNLSGLESVPAVWDASADWPGVPWAVAGYLKALGALFFVPRVDAGLLVALALLSFSRIAWLLSLLGYGVALALCTGLAAFASGPLLQNVGFNSMLVAIALGGIWFVPCFSSFVLAAVASLMTSALSLALDAYSPVVGLAPLTSPFVLMILVSLTALRMRTIDDAPKSVDFTPGSPEQNLDYYQTRLARFGTPQPVALSLPFLGRWTCTQGNDGPHTHQGMWRHGLDFEVRGADGNSYAGDGRRVEDYLCWRLPVLAMADGTVVKVVSDVPDNPLGEVTTAQNWGNLVLIQHAAGRYSMVAHLAQGSVTVQRGSVVRRGATLGLCGNSGRSVIPHLHVQMQADDLVGSATVAFLFSDIIKAGPERQHLHSRLLPREGDVVRNPLRDEALAAVCSLPLGEPLQFAVTRGAHTAEPQTVVPEMDLLGAKRLVRRGTEEALWYEDRFGYFMVYDQVGPRSSALGLMRAAVPKVPFDQEPGLVWEDSLILGQTRSTWRMWLRDLVAPFVPSGGIAMTYRFCQESDGWCVTGESSRRRRSGVPVVQTRALYKAGIGLWELHVEIDGRRVSARREPV